MHHHLLVGKVVHTRFAVKKHSFTYKVFYLYLSYFTIKNIKAKLFSFNKFNLFSFYNKNHGYYKKNATEDSVITWLNDIKHKIDTHNIINLQLTKVVTMPYILGFNFNPVNIWFLYGNNNTLVAMVYQVNNTFGTHHTYVCYKQNLQPITNKDTLTAKKVLHVSPFFTTQGEYKFKINFVKNKLYIYIDYYINNAPQIKTLLFGQTIPLNSKNILLYFLKYPLGFLRSLFLIHYQAIKLFFKRIPFFGTSLLNKQQHHSITYNLTTNREQNDI